MNRIKIKKIKSLIAQSGIAGLLATSLMIPLQMRGDDSAFLFQEELLKETRQGYCMQLFHDVPIIKLVRFVSAGFSEENFAVEAAKISISTYAFNRKIRQFDASCPSANPIAQNTRSFSGA